MKKPFPLFFFALLTILIFWQFFFKHLHPFPGDYLLAWFEPWHTQYSSGGTITLAHKAVASDVFRQFYPFKTLAHEIFRMGQWPLWNPYNGAGQPLLATNNIGLLDPFTVLYFLMPAPYAWSWYIIVQAFLIGWCTYLFARKINLSIVSSLVVAVTFLLSGVVMVRFIYSIFGLAFAMLPFILYLVESYIQEHSKKIYLLPFVIFLVFVSTLPQIAVYVLGFSMVYALVRGWGSWRLGVLGLLGILGVGLSALQLLPTFELSLHANVNAASSQFIFQRFLMAPTHLLTILIPNFFGSDATYNFWEKTDYVETLAYVGTIPVFLAIVGSLKNRGETSIEVSPLSRALRPLFILTILITIFLTLNSSITHWLYSLPVPLISTGVPTRIYLLTTFATAMLAGIGFEKILTTSYQLQTTLLLLLRVFGGFLALVLGIVAYQYLRHIPCPPNMILYCRQVTFRNTVLELAIFAIFVLCTSIFLFGLKSFTIRHKLYAICTLLLITAIGIYNTQKFLPWSPTNSFLPPNPVISELQKHTDGRILGFDNGQIQTDFATYFHFYDPDYYHPLYIKRYGELVAYGNSDKDHPYELLRSDVSINNHATVSASFAAQRNRLLDLLSIKYLLFKKSDLSLESRIMNQESSNLVWQDQNFYLLQNPSALPHAYFVTQAMWEPSDHAILQKLFDPSFDPTSSVVILGNLSLPKVTPESNDPGQARMTNSVKILSYSPNSVSIESTATMSGYVVLTDNDYPGWKAYVDGREMSILQANYTFRAVHVPAGQHIVKFIYDPLSFKVGLWISIMSLIMLCIFFLVRAKRELISMT